MREWSDYDRTSEAGGGLGALIGEDPPQRDRQAVGVGAAELEQIGVAFALEIDQDDLLGAVPEGHRGLGVRVTPALRTAPHEARC